MNQLVKQKIISMLCPKDKWVNDKTVKNCFRCDKKFNKILLRKHHCRICGQVFCGACSQYYVEGIQEKQKLMRMCELCHKKILRYINENEQKDNREKLSFRKGAIDFDRRSQQLKQLIGEDGEEETLKWAQLNVKANQTISILVQMTLKQNGIPFSYYQYLYKLILRIIEQVPPNAMTTGNMNICKHIKILKIKHQDHTKSDCMVGTSVRLQMYSKKIANRYNNVRVLLMYGGMQLSDIMGTTSFQNMIQNRKKQMSNLIYQFVVVLGVNIIFIEKNVQKQIIDCLHENSITVISKVNIGTLLRLKNCLQINKILESVQKIKKQSPEDIIANCKSISLKRYESFSEQEKYYLIVEGEKAVNGVIILISGPSDSLLKRIKKQLRPLLILSRRMLLKLSAIVMDQKLILSKKTECKKSRYPNLLYNSFNIQNVNIAHNLKQKYMTFKKIIFVETDYSIFPQIPRQQYQNLAKESKRFQKKWQNFTQICCPNGQFQDENRRFYSEDDIPLGQYFLKKLLNIGRRCEKCQQPGYKHIQMYYGKNLYVKIQVQSRIIEQQQNKNIEGQSESDDVFVQLSKRKEINKIQNYLECQQCGIKLTSSCYIKQEHFEISFFGFLQYILKSVNFSMLRPYIQPEQKCCPHTKTIRVFQLGDAFLKVYTGFIMVSPKYQISSQTTSQFIQQKNIKHIQNMCLLHQTNIQKVIFYLQQQIRAFSQLTKFQDFDGMMKNPKATILKNKASFAQNNSLTQIQFAEILIPQIINVIQKVQLSSESMLDSKKIKTHCESQFYYKLNLKILNRLYNLITFFKKSSRSFRYNITGQDCDLIDNLDLDSLIESNEEEQKIRKRVGTSHSNSSEITEMNTEMDEKQDQQFENWMTMQRKLTQFEIKNMKQVKISQSEIDKIFKYAQWPFQYEHKVVPHITTNPYVPQSLIAAALNSHLHQQCLESLTSSSIQCLKIKLTQGDNCQLLNENQDLKRIHNIVDVQQKMIGFTSNKKVPCNQVHILFPQMFQRIRAQSQIPLDLFIQTIAGVESWVSTGGKSGSPFMRAHNYLVIVKKITEKQFHCLKKILSGYFKHLQQGSLLTPIYGSYEVTRGQKSEYFIVMENLFFGMKNWQIYDFKGSRTKRFSKPPVVPLDINYLLDRNSQPLITPSNILAYLPKTLDFLADNNIIDYSLVLVFHIDDPNAKTLDGMSIKIGVIDYLRYYGGLQKIQTVIKGLKGNETTVIGAQPYKDRMLASVTRYFCSLPH